VERGAAVKKPAAEAQPGAATGAGEQAAGGQEPAPAGAEETGEERGGGKPDKGPQVTIEVRDAAGALVRTFKAPATLGINRAVWDLRADAPKQPPRGEEPSFREPSGPEALPGTYRVTVKYGGKEASAPVEVRPDPRVQLAEADRRANHDARRRVGQLQQTNSEAIERVRRAAADVDTVLARSKPDKEGADPAADEAYKALDREGKRLKKELEKLESRLWELPDAKGILPPDDAQAQIEYAEEAISSSWDRPTPAQLAYLNQAETTLRAALADLNRFFAQDLAAFRAKVKATELQLLPELPPLEVKGE
jgi:hypothetical protein